MIQAGASSEYSRERMARQSAQTNVPWPRSSPDPPLPRSIGAKASGGAAIEGATLGQLLKRPEVKIEDFLPLLEQAIPYALEGSCPACPAASGARVRAELKAAETAIKYDG